MQESIGQRLKRAREYRNISLEKAGEITRIRPSLLKALEADDFSSMVSAAQARGFLRNYSDYLGLNFDDLLTRLDLKPDETTQDSIPVNPAQVVGPLEKLESTSSGSITDSDQTRVRRELPFWKRTLSFLPSRASQLLASKETEIKTSQDESLEHPEEQIEEEVKPKQSLAAEVGVKTNAAEQPDKDGSQKEQDLIEAMRSTAGVESTQLKSAGELDSGFDKSIIGSSPAQRDPQSTSNSTTARHEGDEDQIKHGAEVDPTRVSLEEKPNLNFFDRIKSAFKIKINGLQASDKPVNINPNMQAASEISQSSLRLPESQEKSVEQYFAEIGEKLRERRALLSLTYEEIERHTHIRSLFLKAMENGAHDQLPSPVQTRGLLANYASFLDLDSDQLLLSYAAALQARHRLKYPELAQGKANVRSIPTLPPIRSFIASDVLFGLGVVAVVIGLAIWGLGRLLNPPSVQQSIESTAPSIAEVLAGTAIAQIPQEVTLIPAQDTPLPTLEATQDAGQGEQELASDAVRVQVSLLAVARTYVRVSSDGEVVFNDQVIPGNSYPFEADQQVEILVGNGAALKVTYAGRDLGLMGNLGEVVNRIYTLNGISTPTITPPPSATSTPPITMTPVSTFTSTPTP